MGRDQSRGIAWNQGGGMKLTLSPRQSFDYSERTATERVYSLKSRYCRGCKKPRSVGQWTAGREVCDGCVRRNDK